MRLIFILVYFVIKMYSHRVKRRQSVIVKAKKKHARLNEIRIREVEQRIEHKKEENKYQMIVSHYKSV